MLFDYKLLKLHRDYSAENLHKSDFLINHAAEDVIEHIKSLKCDLSNVNVMGARGSLIADFLEGAEANFVVSDFSQKLLDKSSAKNKLLIEPGTCPFPTASSSLIISCMDLHFINDVRVFLKEVRSALKPGGCFIANFIGDISFTNLKKLLIDEESKVGTEHSMRVIPMIPAENVYKLLQEAGFNFIVVDRQNLELEYKSVINLMKDLKNMGENNAIHSDIKQLPRGILACNDAFYDEITLVTAVVKT